ncbi:MAG: GTP 3',8-cyclase MoaA [Bacteroidetes bacterium]|nr:GTP 3',8-cyclase MoaA [Bacteroidota bacterium]
MSLSADILTDGFGRRHTYLRISVTERCNLRCTYCMPAEGIELRPRKDMLTFEEIVRLARLFVSEGITKIRLTGGEPLIRRDIEELTRRLAKIEGIEALAITTNGLVLPRKLDALQKAGITHFNISLDTLRPERFRDITLRGGFETVIEAIEMTAASGYDPVKINCVVQRGVNEDEITDFVAWTEKMPLEIRFIEYMPFGGNEWADSLFISYSEMLDTIRSSYLTLQRLVNGPNDTSKTYAVPGYRGRIGFISSMSEHFCASCNRLRITADGNLKVCLFGSKEISLRDAIRSGATDDELRPLIAAAVSRKKASHDGMYEISRSDNRPMILIGG